MRSWSDNVLKAGDLIGVAAPSARFDSGESEKGIQVLERMGFRVRVPDRIYDARRYLAGNDATRARVLTELFRDPEIKAVIAVRGGYGAMRILPLLDWDLLRRHPTRFIGFSDATALISCLVSTVGITAVHGPNLVSLARADHKTLEGFEQAITGRFESLSLAGGTCLIPGQARGRLTGGNLATLAHMTGTKFQPDFTRSILFLEDVGEPAYKIDRMLTQMKMAGVFDQIRGVVLGDFYDCPNPEYIPEILTETFAPLNVPVMTGIPAGHGPVNVAFPMGNDVMFDTASATLRWLD